jgi:hypothetical protein
MGYTNLLQTADEIFQYYQQLSSKVGDISISLCVFPEHIEAGMAVMENVKRALDYFGSSFGQYKNSTMTVVESEVPDGMEYDGLFFFGQEYFESYAGVTRSYLVCLSAHETNGGMLPLVMTLPQNPGWTNP